MRRLLAGLLAAAVGIAAGGCQGDGGPPRPLVIATGNQGGVYYVLGEGLAGAVRATIDGLEPSVLPTAASLENLRLVADGRADVAFTLADSAALAFEGGAPFDGPQPVKALARLYDNYVQLVVPAGSPVRSLTDLRGLAVSTGSPESGTELIVTRLLGTAGIDPASGLRQHRLGIDESARALREGRIDAFFFSGGLPIPAIAELAEDAQIRLVELDAYVDRLRVAHGEFYAERSIPASTYGLQNAVPTIGVPNYLVVNAGMDEEVAYQLTRLLFAERQLLVDAHPEARRLNRRAAITTSPVPLHPGAERYYREVKL